MYTHLDTQQLWQCKADISNDPPEIDEYETATTSYPAGSPISMSPLGRLVWSEPDWRECPMNGRAAANTEESGFVEVLLKQLEGPSV